MRIFLWHLSFSFIRWEDALIKRKQFLEADEKDELNETNSFNHERRISLKNRSSKVGRSSIFCMPGNTNFSFIIESNVEDKVDNNNEVYNKQYHYQSSHEESLLIAAASLTRDVLAFVTDVRNIYDPVTKR